MIFNIFLKYKAVSNRMPALIFKELEVEKFICRNSLSGPFALSLSSCGALEKFHQLLHCWIEFCLHNAVILYVFTGN